MRYLFEKYAFLKYAYIVAFLCLISSASLNGFDRSKTFEKTYSVKPAQRIELYGFSGSDMEFRSWDKNEVYIKLKVRFSSSDDKFESEYINALGIDVSNHEDALILKLKETDNQGGVTSFLGIKFRIGFYQKREIKGEIYLPRKNAFTSDFKYGTMTLEDMQGAINLEGKSNTLRLKNCTNLQVIENDYGKTNISNSGGNLELSAKSSTVSISGFNGPADILADYSNCRISDIGGSVNMQSKSGTSNISEIRGNLKLNADYSNIKINTVAGFVGVFSKSATISVLKAGGVSVEADYSNVTLSNISGKSGREIFIKSRSGSLDMEDAAGEVTIDNPYSNMNLRNIKGNISITGQSSTITATGITGNWNSKTQYVTFRLRDLSSGSIKMTNKSGNIELSSRNTPQEVDIVNEYGGVTIDMPRGFNGEVNLSAIYGHINTDMPLKVREKGSNMEASGKAGSGSGRISIETRSGNIEINQL